MPLPWLGLLVDLLPGRGDLVDLVGAVVEEAGVGDARHAPDLVLVVTGSSVEGMNSALRASTYGVMSSSHFCEANSAVQTTSASKTSQSRGLGALALDELVALLVGGLRELEQLGVQARVGLVELLDGPLEVARGVLAGAVRTSPFALSIDATSILGALGLAGAPRATAAAPRRRRRTRRRRMPWRQPGTPPTKACDPSCSPPRIALGSRIMPFSRRVRIGRLSTAFVLSRRG